MSEINRVHHINFLYRDLEAAIATFESALGVGPFIVDELTSRGARIARARVGETWFVLVSPTRADSVPGRYLEKHGEGFFLISFGVDDLASAIEALEKRTNMTVGPVRTGVADWQIADLPADATLGLQLQLAENSGDGSGR